MADLTIGADIVAITTTAGKSIVPIAFNLALNPLVPGVHRYISVDVTSGSFDDTLPDPEDPLILGVPFRIIRIDASANDFNLLALAGDSIQEAAGISLPDQYDSVEVISDGTPIWKINILRLLVPAAISADRINTECIHFADDSTTNRATTYEANTNRLLGAKFIQEFDVSSETTVPLGVEFSHDGLFAYVFSSNTIFQYNIVDGVPVYSTKSLAFGAIDNSISDVRINESGDTMLILGNENNSIYQLDIVNIGDISTGTVTESGFSVATEDSVPSAMCVQPGGKLVIISGDQNNTLYSYTFPTGWKVAGGAYTTKSFDYSSLSTQAFGIFCRPDGYYVYLNADVPETKRIIEIPFKQAWDLDTLSATDPDIKELPTEEGLPRGLCFDYVRSFLYYISSTNDSIVQKSLGINTNNVVSSLVSPDAVEYPDKTTQATAVAPNDFGWPIRTTELENTHDMNAEVVQPRGIYLPSNAAKLYIADHVTQAAYEYDIDSPLNLKNAPVYTTDSLAIGTSPAGMVLKEDLNAIYFAIFGGTIREFQLSTAGSLASAGSVIVHTKGPTTSVGFSVYNNGRDVLFALNTGFIEHWEMTKAWDWDTLVDTGLFFDTGFNWGNGGDVRMRPDGKRIIATNATAFEMVEYAVDTAWNITTMRQVNAQSIDAATELFIDPAGNKMYTMHQFQDDDLHEYTLGIKTFSITSDDDIKIKGNSPEGTGSGGTVIIESGDGGATSGTAGSLSMSAGSAKGAGDNSGGTCTVSSGDSTGGNSAGTMSINGGDGGTTGFGGDARVNAGDGGSTSGPAGDAHLTGGDAVNGDAGKVIIESGTDAATGDRGVITANGQEVSRQSPTVFEIFSVANFPNAPSGGEILLPSGIYIMKAGIVISDVFRIDTGAQVLFRSETTDTFAITYTGTATLFITTDGASLNLVNMAILSTGNGVTFFDLANLAIVLNVENTTAQFTGTGASLGTISNVAFAVNFDIFSAIGFAVGLTVDQTPIFTMKEILVVTDFSGGTDILTVNDGTSIGNMTIDTFSVQALTASDNIFNIDPTFLGGASIQNVTNSLGANFYKAGSGEIPFTAVDDASIITPIVITSVSDVGGLAEFNYTGVAVHEHQEVVIVDFITNTTYNATFIITTSGAGTFQTGVAFTGSEASVGSFTSDSILITSNTHGLGNGQKLLLETELATDYDGGAITYQSSTNQFRANREFDPSGNDYQDGTWDTGSLTGSNSHVRASNNTGEQDSAITIEGLLVGNVTTTVIPAAGAKVIIAASTWTQENAERIKITKEGLSIFTGNEPAKLSSDGNITLEPASSTKSLSTQFFKHEEARTTVTFTNGTNIVDETGTALVDDDTITFNENQGTLPAELSPNVIYHIVSATANTFQLSYTEGGVAITFTDDGSGTNTYAVALLKGIPPVLPIASNSPRTLSPKALLNESAGSRTGIVVINNDDTVDIEVSDAYYRSVGI